VFGKSHLSLLDRHRLPPGRRLLVDAGQEVLGDPQGVLQKRVVRVAGGRVFEQVLEYRGRCRNINLGHNTIGKSSKLLFFLCFLNANRKRSNKVKRLEESETLPVKHEVVQTRFAFNKHNFG